MNNVAIVNDDPDLIRLYRLGLESRGFNIAYTASDGIEAIRSQRDAPIKPDVILMDHHMPNMDGLTSARAIRQEYPDSKIVMLSITQDYSDRLQGSDGLYYFYIPCSIKELIKFIKSLT